MSTPDRDAVKKVFEGNGNQPMTISELAEATGIPRPRVACAVNNAPRDTFKRAHGTRKVDGKNWPLFELGARELPPVATGNVWQI